MRQDERAPFHQALQRARLSAYGPGEFVGQESFMRADEILSLAVRAGVGRGTSVLDLCCGVAGPGRYITSELGCTYLGVDLSADAIDIARERAGAETLNYEDVDVQEALRDMTGGRGPDHCIDAVGLEGHSPGLMGAYDKVKTNLFLETDRPVALREAILACRSGGTISVAGVYGGFIDKFPMGAIVNRSLTIRSGQTHVQRYMQPLLQLVVDGKIDPSFVITHRLPLTQAPMAYEKFCNKEDGFIKVVLDPAA